MAAQILFIAFGFILLVKGADLLVKGAAGIAKRFGLSEMMIGLTIVAIGTSLPEVFITIKSAMLGQSDLIIGNAIGSSICNFLLVIGLASLIKPIRVDKRITKVHIPIGIGSMVLLLVLGNTDTFGNNATITRVQGVILLLATVLYILYTIYEEKKLKAKHELPEEIETEEEKHTPIERIILYIVVGVVALKWGADFVVDNATLIAKSFEISERVIGMTIVAVGTALPEIVTSIIASIKNESDLILGNVSGSNILNLCLLIGLGAVINPMVFSAEFNASVIMLIAVTVIVAIISIMDKDNRISRAKGALLMLIYFVYTMRLFI